MLIIWVRRTPSPLLNGPFAVDLLFHFQFAVVVGVGGAEAAVGVGGGSRACASPPPPLHSINESGIAHDE